ncbi:hypothetical protein G7Z17_g283 [Cylindrodendrum hubeiense]|uniref:Uncharacterized protein n=1 Tax=Cylindrodendrum hubeiense TaxID=595255 RepID=A0A9P5HN64_9HYPO|nr:hypothetical protein G7Z17_g283 [Cylindrodendrum hubeiense]
MADEWEGDYADFDDYIETELFETNDRTTQEHGGLKSFKTKDGGLVHFSDDPSGFTVSVERLLQVDGFDDEKTKQRMTLIILKVVLASNEPGQKIKHVTFSMEFKDLKPPDKAEPKLLAWAPFDSMVRSNMTKVDREKTAALGAKLGGGGGGGTAEVSAGLENKISWSQSYFDTGHAYAIMDKKTQQRSGVRWVLESNPMEVSGVPPGITVAMLLSRTTDEPYLAEFNIRVTGGSMHNLRRGIKSLLGLKPGMTQPYKVAPTKEPIKRGEGENLFDLAKIDPNNLGRLRGKGELPNLAVVWGGDQGTNAGAEKKEEVETGE